MTDRVFALAIGASVGAHLVGLATAAAAQSE